LKLENLAGKRFSYMIDCAINEIYNFTVAVPGKELTAVIDNTIFSEATINDTGAVDIMITPWESNSIFSLDFIGFRQTRLGASDIVALIDSIGLVNLESKEKIDTALEAFEKLPGFEQEQVSNYDALLYMYNFCSSLEYNYMIYEAQDLIDAIGTVGYGSAAAIRTAEFAVARLTDEQKAKVSNLDVFMKAKSKFYELTKDKMEFESYANPFSLRFNFEGHGELWDKSSSEKLANNGYRFNFVEAVRDVRNGSPLGIPLDGLFMRLANLTAEEGSNGEGTKLSIQIGTTDTSYRNGDITCAAMALVLDTYEGALYAYPGRHLLIKDEVLKQSNIENKEFSVRFDITPEKLYILTLKIEKQEFFTIMPTSLMYNENIALRTDNVTVALTPWVNTYNGTTDRSKHTFSVDFLSMQSNGYYAFEIPLELVEKINKLPEKITESDIEEVYGILADYKALPRSLRQYVSNYDKLSDAIGQVYDLEIEDYSAWDVDLKAPIINDDVNTEIGDKTDNESVQDSDIPSEETNPSEDEPTAPDKDENKDVQKLEPDKKDDKINIAPIIIAGAALVIIAIIVIVVIAKKKKEV